MKAVRVWMAVALLTLLGPARALDLNQANRAQLEQLNGIGVDMADRLLKERAKAPFQDWNDLQRRVKGLSAKRIEQLRAQGAVIQSQSTPSVPSTPSTATPTR